MMITKAHSIRHKYRPSDELVPEVLAGSVPAISRMISRAEAGYDEAAPALARLYRAAGKAHVVGITGVPGGGKSTLISALIRSYVAAGSRVAVVAIDPSSPYSGGAILGDRIRMSGSARPEEAFIRSMATRGHLGGLSRATLQAVDILDAAGYSPIFIETVGVGQDEVEIMTAAHTVVVLSPPGLGDEIQAIKAGVMEIADIHAVSKGDKPEAAMTTAALKAMIALGAEMDRTTRQPPVIQLSSATGNGIGDLTGAISAHLAHLEASNEIEARRHGIARTRVLAAINDLIRRRFDEGTATLRNQLVAVTRRDTDPLTAARQLLGTEIMEGLA